MTSLNWLAGADGWSPWPQAHVVVAGIGVSGFAAADNLNHLGASVIALDESDAGDRAEKAELLRVLGADVRLGPGTTATLPEVDASIGSAARICVDALRA